MKVASWELEEIQVFWNDYPTRDWTWERDYIHVVDLIEWHIKALEYISSPLLSKRGVRGELWKMVRGELWKGLYEEINLWTWKSTSVLEMIKITEEIVWKKLKYKIVERRPWDIAVSYCDPKKAKKLLNWEAKYDIKQAIKNSWNFISKQKK
jgi:UDP-glucose 4-epimerase